MEAPSLLRTSTTSPVDLDPQLSPRTASLQAVEGVPGAYLLAPVLSRSECEQLIAASEALGYAPKKSRRSGPPVRTNARLLYEAHPALVDAMAERMRPHLASLD